MKRTNQEKERLKENTRSLAVVMIMMMMITAFGAMNVPTAANNK